MIKYLFFLFIFSSCASNPVGQFSPRVLDVYDVKLFNQGLKKEKPTVDLVLQLIKGSKVSWVELKPQIEFAKKSYGKVGLQIRVLKAEKIFVPKDHRSLVGILPSQQPKANIQESFPYKEVESKKNRVPKKTENIFSSIVKDSEDSSRQIHILVGFDVSYSFYEKRDGRWVFETIPVSGLSFAAYSLQDRIPRHLRGVVTVSKNKHASLLAHELGHKLINVSHEGKNVCPQFSGDKVPGLMGYNGESDIFSGPKGRFHGERLLKSPFVYQVKNGKKKFNQDYQKGGVYRDPIYGTHFFKEPCKKDPFT